MKISLYRPHKFGLFPAPRMYGPDSVAERFALSDLISERPVADVSVALVRILVLVIVVVLVISPIPIGSGAT